MRLKIHDTIEKIYRRWGNWEVIKKGNFNETEYKIKLLSIDPGKSISLQYHDNRDEYWIIMRGLARVDQGWDLEDETLETYYHGAGDTLFIPKQTKHKIENIGTAELLILELQMGSECDEEDITRLEKIDGEDK